MDALPSWLCLLFSLQTLYIDGNTFEGPWKALVEPLLAKVPMTPTYPHSTPMFPLPSASIVSSTGDTETDNDDFSEPPADDRDGKFTLSPEDEDTITPGRAPFVGRAITAPSTATYTDEQDQQVRRPLARTRTTYVD